MAEAECDSNSLVRRNGYNRGIVFMQILVAKNVIWLHNSCISRE